MSVKFFIKEYSRIIYMFNIFGFNELDFGDFEH